MLYFFQNIFKRNKTRSVLSTLALVLLIGFVLAPHIAHADVFPSAKEIAVTMVSSLFVFLAEVLLRLSSLLLWVVSLILEGIIRLSVINMRLFVENEGVNTAWRVFRDVANMFFIFILLYAAIGTILSLDNINLKKLIRNVVIVGLLLNFSFFFTKVAVDASNILAVTFYNQITQTQCGSGPAGDIGSAFTCKLGVTSVYSDDILKHITNPGDSSDWATPLKILMLGVGGSIFIVVTAFVLAAAAVLFMYRLIVFIFLFILSPLAFMSMALPNDKYSGDWFKALIDNSIFAPFFMMLIWATLQIIARMPGVSGGASLATAILGTTDGGPTPDSTAVFITFVTVIALMIGSMIIAKKTGAYGADTVKKKFDGAIGWTQGKLGRGAVRASGIRSIDESLKNSEFGNTRFGRKLREATTGTITGMKFGSKESVSSYDKKLAKGDEALAKKKAENIENRVKSKIDTDAKNSTLYRNNVQSAESDMVRNRLLLNKYYQIGIDPSSTAEEKAEANRNFKRIEGEMAKSEAARKDNAEKLDRAEKLQRNDKEETKKLETEKSEAVQTAKNDAATEIEQKTLKTPKYVAGLARGASAGAAVGAGLGSFIPVAGTAVGAGVGAVVGGGLGLFWGHKSKNSGMSPNDRKTVVDVLRGKKKLKGDAKKALQDLGLSEDDIKEFGKDEGGGGEKEKKDEGGGGNKKS